MEIRTIFFEKPLANYSYLLLGGKNICIDPFDGEVIEKSFSGKIDYIINTHKHFDHIGGNDFLIEKYGAEVINNGDIELGEGYSISLISTPGHTMDHIGVILKNNGRVQSFFSGDTIFNGGVGNCRNGGDPKILYKTVRKLVGLLSDEVLLYPGHDYYQTNLRYIENLQLLDETPNQKLPMSFKIEKSYNPFLRVFDAPFLSRMKDLGLIESLRSEVAFLKLRSLRNDW